MNVRAICTDIDGTLLDSRRELSVRTIEAIRKVNKKIPVILASSRMPAAMRHLQQELDILDHPLICYNGGYVISYSSNATSPEIFETVTIPPKICESIISLASGTDIHVSLYQNDEWSAPRVDNWTIREQTITKVNARIEELHQVIERWRNNNLGAHKIMCMGPEQEISTLAKQLHQQHGNDIHIYFSRSTYLELAPRSISKATALELILAKQFKLTPSDAMAFGDNYNDMDMLQSVGLGIAVANARDEVKAVAKEITGKSVEDGVAIAIERYCGNS